jgi:membrane protein implicated in regulation of membrane protease activity
MFETSALDLVDWTYFATFGVGLVWAIVTAVLGGLGDVDVPAGDFEADLGDFDGLSAISPITIATFITGFGATGIITKQLFGVSSPISLLWATGGGLLLAAVMFVFYSRFLIGSQGSSELRIGQLVGKVAEVTAPIPADSTGEIALVAQGARVTYPARSSHGQPIGRGVLVTIEQMIGGVALVAPRS